MKYNRTILSMILLNCCFVSHVHAFYLHVPRWLNAQTWAAALRLVDKITKPVANIIRKPLQFIQAHPKKIVLAVVGVIAAATVSRFRMLRNELADAKRKETTASEAYRRVTSGMAEALKKSSSDQLIITGLKEKIESVQRDFKQLEEMKTRLFQRLVVEVNAHSKADQLLAVAQRRLVDLEREVKIFIEQAQKKPNEINPEVLVQRILWPIIKYNLDQANRDMSQVDGKDAPAASTSTTTTVGKWPVAKVSDKQDSGKKLVKSDPLTERFSQLLSRFLGSSHDDQQSVAMQGVTPGQTTVQDPSILADITLLQSYQGKK